MDEQEGKTRGRRALTRDIYETLLAAFREAPGAFAASARRAGVDPRTAKRLWKGPPLLDYPWARPIRLVLEEERLEALARARDEERRAIEASIAEREKGRAAAIEVRAQEEQVSKLARGNVIAALGMAAELVPAMRALSRVIQDAAKPGPNGEPPAIRPGDAMHLLSRHSTMLTKAVNAAQQVLDLGRLDRGEPTAIVGVAGGFPDGRALSYEEALLELEESERLLGDARRRGLALEAGDGEELLD